MTADTLWSLGATHKETKLVHRLSGKCLKVATGGTSDTFVLDECKDDDQFMMWYLHEFHW